MDPEPNFNHTSTGVELVSDDLRCRRIRQAVLEDAYRDATAFCEFLSRLAEIRNCDPTELRCTFEQALTLVAFLRLRQWEASQFLQYLPEPLPSAEEVLMELLAKGTDQRRYSGRGLMIRILAIRLHQMAWRRPAGCTGDVVIASVDTSGALDAAAQLLWRHRHLSGDEEKR